MSADRFRLALLVLAIVAAIAVLWITRYEVTCPSGKWGACVVTNRWTGDTEVRLVSVRRQE